MVPPPPSLFFSRRIRATRWLRPSKSERTNETNTIIVAVSTETHKEKGLQRATRTDKANNEMNKTQTHGGANHSKHSTTAAFWVSERESRERDRGFRRRKAKRGTRVSLLFFSEWALPNPLLFLTFHPSFFLG